MGVIFGDFWSNPQKDPVDGQVADGKYRYYANGTINTPSSGSVYSGGQWLTPAQYQQQQSQLSYQKVAGAAANKLNTLLQNPESITSTPGYQFAYNQGLEAVNRTAAAKGQLGSGNRLYELTKFGQGLASQSYNNTVSQLTDVLNRNPVVQDSNGRTSSSSWTTAGKLNTGWMGG